MALIDPRQHALVVGRNFRGLLRLSSRFGLHLTFSAVTATLAMLCEVAALSLAFTAAITLTGEESAAVNRLVLGGFSAGSLPVPLLLLVALGFGIGAVALHLAKGFIAVEICSSFEYEQRVGVSRAFLNAAFPKQAEERTAVMSKILTQSIPLARRSLTSVGDIIETTCSVVVLVGAALFVNRQVVLPAILSAALLFFLLRPLSMLSRHLSRLRGNVALRYCQLALQGVMMAREIRVFWAGDAYQRLLTEAARQDKGLVRRMLFLSSAVPSLYQSFTLLLLIGACAAIYALKLPGVPQLGFLALLMVRALGLSRGYQVAYHSMLEGLPWLDEVQAFTAGYEADALRSGERKLARIDAITFRNVSFEYEPGTPILKDLNFTVRAGEIIGIIGPSGSGKSTLIQLLLRLRTPTHGAIDVNGVPIQEYTFPSWYANVSYVAQDSVLLEDRVDENIRFFRDHLTQSELERAAHAAFLERELAAWPQGYATEVGERGARVSGGQRQRITIARALAGGPQCLILDEPTSALDVHSEVAVQEALGALKGQVTVFVVAHRLSTLSICDRIMSLENGKITGFDAPEALARSNAYYEEAQRMALNV